MHWRTEGPGPVSFITVVFCLSMMVVWLRNRRKPAGDLHQLFTVLLPVASVVSVGCIGLALSKLFTDGLEVTDAAVGPIALIPGLALFLDLRRGPAGSGDGLAPPPPRLRSYLPFVILGGVAVLVVSRFVAGDSFAASVVSALVATASFAAFAALVVGACHLLRRL